MASTAKLPGYSPSWWGSWGRNSYPQSRRKGCTDSFFVCYTADFLCIYTIQGSAHAMVPPTEGWVFLHQLTVKTIPRWHTHRPTQRRQLFTDILAPVGCRSTMNANHHHIFLCIYYSYRKEVSIAIYLVLFFSNLGRVRGFEIDLPGWIWGFKHSLVPAHSLIK